MRSKIGYLLWPVAQVFLVTKAISKKLFELKVWKSVSFQAPVISMTSFSKDPVQIKDIEQFQKLLSGWNMTSGVALSAGQSIDYKLSKQKLEEFTYVFQSAGGSDWYSLRHLLLGISELAMHGRSRDFLLLPSKSIYTEVEPALRVLIIDAQQPVYRQRCWPMAKRIMPLSYLEQIDAVAVVNAENELQLKEIKEDMEKLVTNIVPFFSLSEMNQIVGNTNSSDNQKEVGIFIDDRNNFEDLLQAILNQSEEHT